MRRKLSQFLYRAARPRTLALIVAVLALAAPAMFAALGTSARSRAVKPGKPAQNSASVQVDKTRYVAGETVTITGSGFTPLESVMLQVKHAGGTTESGMGHEAIWVYPDAAGRFQATWSINGDDSAGTDFVVTVSGSSGAHAQAAFSRTALVSTNQFVIQAGDSVQVKASGFNANQLVTLQVNGKEAVTGVTNENGQLTAALNVAETIEASSIAVQALAPEVGIVSNLTPVNTNWFIITDQQGADDVNSNQVDMNLMGRLDDAQAIRKYVAAWDSTDSWTGSGQTGDICFLFDKNNNGNADFAACVRVTNFNANVNDVRVVPADTNKPVFLFDCTDKRNDRCSQPSPHTYSVNEVVTGSFENTLLNDAVAVDMVASQTINDNLKLAGSDPFTGCATGQSPVCAGPSTHSDTDDTVVEVHILTSILPKLADGVTPSTLVNVCSFPSAGNGGNNNPFDCVVTPGDGFLRIIKEAGGSTQQFTFTVGPPAPSSPQPATYTLVDTACTLNGQPVSPCEQTDEIGIHITTNLKVVETIPVNWQLDSVVCTLQGGASTGSSTIKDYSTQQATIKGKDSIEIKSGELTTCTFTNSLATGTLIVIKTVNNGAGGTAVASNFSYTFDNNTSSFGGLASPGKSHTLTTGTAFNVKELNGTTQMSAGDTITVGNVVYEVSYSQTGCSGTISAGVTTTCTITNTARKASPAGTTILSFVIHDSLTITGIRSGASDAANAKVHFRAYTGSDCAVGTLVGSELNRPISNGVAATSTGIAIPNATLGASNTFYMQAEYTGDAYNNGYTTACTAEKAQITVKDNYGNPTRDGFAGP
jgi:hypothetical protein